ncbi:CpaD family pilus assembly protein [Sphingomonas sp.]|uniref:CpaD family pilus assembly protein n=1 Tax=Sphingomonas sp. TaxID=28214 RepID=UPI00286EAB32|nr:CpaD family pilus assembly protein [Sphingomonas sp.]
MRMKIGLLLLGSAVAGCNHVPQDLPDRGVSAVHTPVVSRADYVFDVAAPDGMLPPQEAARLDAFFSNLGVSYGDSIYIDAGYAGAARAEIERIAGNYGLLVSAGAPVTAGAVAPGSARVIVSRLQAAVAGCPDWNRPGQPNYNNRTLPNFGCGVNSALAAMVANPQDLVHGREGTGVGDAFAGAKAIVMYQNWPLTGIIDGQVKRPLKIADTKKDDK